MCKRFLFFFFSFHKVRWTVTLAAAAQVHLAHNLKLRLHLRRSLFHRVRLQLWRRFALLFCWLHLLAGLIAVWSLRPVATCQRCSSHIHCSAPAASDKILFVSFLWLLFFLALAEGQTFFVWLLFCFLWGGGVEVLFSFFATHRPTAHCSSDDSRQMAAGCRKAYIFMGLPTTTNAILSLNEKRETGGLDAPKKILTLTAVRL